MAEALSVNAWFFRHRDCLGDSGSLRSSSDLKNRSGSTDVHRFGRTFRYPGCLGCQGGCIAFCLLVLSGGNRFSRWLTLICGTALICWLVLHCLRSSSRWLVNRFFCGVSSSSNRGRLLSCGKRGYQARVFNMLRLEQLNVRSRGWRS